MSLFQFSFLLDGLCSSVELLCLDDLPGASTAREAASFGIVTLQSFLQILCLADVELPISGPKDIGDVRHNSPLIWNGRREGHAGGSH